MTKVIIKGAIVLVALAVLTMLVIVLYPMINRAKTVTEPQIRNLTFRRTAYQSSAYNFNETAHLITDGIIGAIEDEKKMNFGYSHEHGNDSRYGNAKRLFDYDSSTSFESYNRTTWVQVRLPRRVAVGSYQLTSSFLEDWFSPSGADPKAWTLQGSNDGSNFTTIDTQSDQTFSGRGETNTYAITNPAEKYNYYRLQITGVNGSDRIHLADWSLLDAEGNQILIPYGEDDFASCWISQSNKDEWVYVDLGAQSKISSVKIFWGSSFAKAYEIQVSEDTKNWETIATDDNGTGGEKELIFDEKETRYVRLLCKETASEEDLGFIVREFEVYGTNDLKYEVDQLPDASEDGTLVLTGGNWTIERASVVDAVANLNADPEKADDSADTVGCLISTKDYDSKSWLPAVVPGTVLTSFIKAGAVADPNYGDQQFLVSDSFFKSNFWYRNHFEIPKSRRGEKVWLNFEAINYKAEVYFNGQRVGNILGGFTRAKFDVTPYVDFGKQNYLAVLIYKNTDPGTPYVSGEYGPGTMGGVFGNDGSIGADGPTHTASAGWDWVPTVRGRNIGIYNDVFINYSKDAQIVDPWMVTTFDKNADGSLVLSKANLTLKTEISNTNSEAVTAVIKGEISDRSDLTFEKEIVLDAGQTQKVAFDSIVMENPELWWPNTYGDQPLYSATVSVWINGKKSDSKSFQFGVREFTYQMEPGDEEDPNGYINGNNLALYCNGALIICRGGNWGMEDINLDVSDEEFDDKIRLHKEANFTMIRNWGGQTNDPGFYNACDKYGILIWDDFFMPGGWLHVPDDVDLFLANAEDKVKDYRSHPSLAFYCGINETWPEKRALEDGFRKMTTDLDGTRLYFPNSRWDPVGPGGPYSARGPKFYFKSTTPKLITSERGLPNIPVVESMKAIFPEAYQFPKNSMWSLHDMADFWNCGGKQYMQDCSSYGSYSNLEEFVRNAQMVGYENHKAIFEATFETGSYGMLMWMSQSVWPSLIWQTYDYFHDVNGSYFGIKTGNQPINYIWNIANNQMVLYNMSATDQKGLNAIVELYDLNGKLLYAKNVTKDMKAGAKEELFELAFAENSTKVQLIRTRVENASGDVIAEDFYWNNYVTYQDYTTMADMAKAEITAEYEFVETKDSSNYYRILVENNTDKPAIMIRLKVMNSETGERVLPVFYEDNYFSLMPGEVKEITLDFKEKHLNGAEPRFEMEGFNVEPSIITEGKKAFTIGNLQMEINGMLAGYVQTGEANLFVDIYVKENTDVKGELIAELYKNNELVDTKIMPISTKITSGGRLRITTDSIYVPEGNAEDRYTMKGYVRDGDNLLKPVKTFGSQEDFIAAPPVFLKRNLAVGCNVTVSSTEESENVAQNAVDGSIGSRWASQSGSDNEWLLVDLGNVATFNAISINWEAAFAKEYRIEISEDGENFTEIVHKTDGIGGIGGEKEDAFHFSPVISARYIRWVGVKRGTDWGYSMYEFSVFTTTQKSLATDAIVTASDSESHEMSPDKIVDGEMSTRWAAKEGKDDHFVLLDLQESKTFSSIELTWENAYGKEYILQTSMDGVNYTDLITETNGHVGTMVYQFDPVTAKFIKVQMIKRGTDWTYSIYELGVY
ncbi:MAG: type domain protein [Herbinix sp.]|nr:type domain protein [Herbinix sp.]